MWRSICEINRRALLMGSSIDTPKISPPEIQETLPVSLSVSYVYIVAIDIGTTYSGYAYANKNEIDFSTGTFNLHYNQAWHSGNPNLFSLKTPTCILLDNDQNVKAFGYEAEKQYFDLVEDGKAKDYYCFRSFKMALYEGNSSFTLSIKDEGGKELPARVVFSKSILAFKEDFFHRMEKQHIQLNETEIRWVITVPAIWSDAAKQFMRTCAIKAGIPNNQMIIALEPEAASIYCQFVKTKKLTDAQLTFSKPGTQYVVVDLGGGTADIVVHEIMGNGYVKEIDRAKGSDCGGNSINESLIREIKRTIGGPLLQEVKQSHPSVYLDFHREFEAAKKQFNPAMNVNSSLRLPHDLLNAFFKEKSGESLTEMVQLGPNFPGAYINKHGYLKITPSGMESILFKPTVNKIIELLKGIIEKTNNPKLKKILLVGGMSESEFIQNTICSAFPSKLVIVPENPGLCVVKGAVLFGRDPQLISHRVIRYTYGIKGCPLFDKSVHDPTKRCTIAGKDRCNDVFFEYIKTGAVVEMNKKMTQVFRTTEKFQKIMGVCVYISSKEDPKYVDEDNCKHLGELKVTIPNPTEEIRFVEVSFVFGNTELNIFAKDITSDKECQTTFNFVHF